MEMILETGMAGLLDAAMLLLVFHFVRSRTSASAFEKCLCAVMLFCFALGMALGEVQHARVFLILCGLGAVLCYAAEGLAFAEQKREDRHE